MSRRCQVCGKKAIITTKRKKLRGNYNPTAKKKKYPNLQWMHLDNGKRIKACTRCIRTANRTKEKTEIEVQTGPETEAKPETAA